MIFFEKFRNLEFFQGTENFDFFFFERNLRSTSLMPLVPRPFLKILSFFFLKICSLSKKSEEDEDDDGVKVIMIFFFFWLKNLFFE